MKVLLLLAASVCLAATEPTPTAGDAESEPTTSPTPTSTATTVTTADVTPGADDASPTARAPPPPAERIAQPSGFVPSPQLGATHADVDGWSVSAPLVQPPLAASSRHHKVALLSGGGRPPLHSKGVGSVETVPASQQLLHPGFPPLPRQLVRAREPPEPQAAAAESSRPVLTSDVTDPVDLYLGAMKARARPQGGWGKFDGPKASIQDLLELEDAGRHHHQTLDQQLRPGHEADYEQLQRGHAGGQKLQSDFPPVWGESRVRGQPVRFEEDSAPSAVSAGLRPVVGDFPYHYEQPAVSVPEIIVPSSLGPKHRGKSKVGVIGPPTKSRLVQRVLHALAAFIPLGLFLASLQPSVVTVNASAPAPGGASRQRSADVTPGSDCEARLLCDAASRGRRRDADASARALWLAAHQTPDKMAEALGLGGILKAVRTGQCQVYRCHGLEDESLDSLEPSNETMLPREDTICSVDTGGVVGQNPKCRRENS